MREDFKFRTEWYEAVMQLPEEYRMPAIDAIVSYATTGIRPEVSGIIAAILTLIGGQIERDYRLYLNGAKGGRPKNQPETNLKPNGNQSITKAEPTGNQTETKSNQPETNSNAHACVTLSQDNNIYQDNIQDIDNNPERVRKESEGKKRRERDPADEVEKRKQEFYDSLRPYSGKYSAEMLRAFFDYWTERTKSGRKMRFEMERTWELRLRLATWAKREDEYQSRKATPPPRAPAPSQLDIVYQQNMETMRRIDERFGGAGLEYTEEYKQKLREQEQNGRQIV